MQMISGILRRRRWHDGRYLTEYEDSLLREELDVLADKEVAAIYYGLRRLSYERRTRRPGRQRSCRYGGGEGKAEEEERKRLAKKRSKGGNQIPVPKFGLLPPPTEAP